MSLGCKLSHSYSSLFKVCVFGVYTVTVTVACSKFVSLGCKLLVTVSVFKVCVFGVYTVTATVVCSKFVSLGCKLSQSQ